VLDGERYARGQQQRCGEHDAAVTTEFLYQHEQAGAGEGEHGNSEGLGRGQQSKAGGLVDGSDHDGIQRPVVQGEPLLPCTQAELLGGLNVEHAVAVQEAVGLEYDPCGDHGAKQGTQPGQATFFQKLLCDHA